MKRIENLFCGVVIIAGVVGFGSLLYSGLSSDPTATSKPAREPQDLVITTPEPRTDGRLTIVTADGSSSTVYSDQITISSDGTNGEAVEITIYERQEETIHGEEEN